MAHHDRTGKLLLGPRVLGIGLAGGLFIELRLTGAIEVAPDGIVYPGVVRYPLEPLTAHLRQIVGTERPRPAGDWLTYIARTADEDVGQRLERSGFVARSRGWVPWSTRRQPASPEWAVAAGIRASRAGDLHNVVLAALVVACQLTFRLDQLQLRSVRDTPALTARLDPQITDLLAQTRAQVDSALLSHRTLSVVLFSRISLTFGGSLCTHLPR